MSTIFFRNLRFIEVKYETRFQVNVPSNIISFLREFNKIKEKAPLPRDRNTSAIVSTLKRIHPNKASVHNFKKSLEFNKMKSTSPDLSV